MDTDMNLNPNGRNELQMMERINELEQELARKHDELESVRSNAQDRLTVVESKLLAFENNQHSCGPNQKTLVNKPEIFNGESDQSLDAFIGHMDLYVSTVPDSMKLKVAVSFLSGHAYDWFKVIENVDNVDSWDRLKDMMKSRFEPINKVKSARDKLARWRQERDVSHYNESFLKIIINIPNISKDEVIDRYLRGLRPEICQELCTNEYDSITKVMSDALSIEAAKNSFRKWNPRPRNPNQGGWPRSGPPTLGTWPRPNPNGGVRNRQFNPNGWSHPIPPGANGPTPMDISNTNMRFPVRDAQWYRDKNTGACFKCHRQGCRWETCPYRHNVPSAAPVHPSTNVSNVVIDPNAEQGKDGSQ